MTVDLIGVAAVIVAVGTPLTVVLTQYNTRRAIRDAADAAAAAALEAKEQAAASAQAAAVASAQIHEVVNSKHAEALAEIIALQGEVRRLQVPGATTPETQATVTLAQSTGTVTVEAPVD